MSLYISNVLNICSVNYIRRSVSERVLFVEKVRGRIDYMDKSMTVIEACTKYIDSFRKKAFV